MAQLAGSLVDDQELGGRSQGMDEILRLKDLSFRYEEEKEWALKEVSLSISSGEKLRSLGITEPERVRFSGAATES